MSIMPMPQKIRTTEWLAKAKAINLSPRAIKASDHVEVHCYLCNEVGAPRAGNIDSSLKSKGYGYCCKKCKKIKISNSAKARTGDKNSFFGKTHSTESKNKISQKQTERLSKVDSSLLKERSCIALEASYAKYGGNPMHDPEIALKHYESTHSAEFLKKSRERGLRLSKQDGFAEKQSEYSNKYWSEDGEAKKAAQREVFLKRASSTPGWNELKEKGLSKYLSDPERIKATWDKVAKTCLKLYGAENWRNSADADKRATSFSSKAELEILSWIQTFFPNAKKHRSGGHEIDIFIPEKNIGIEYNGLYWHSELHKDKNYHKLKSDYFKSQGIRIIHVFEHTWKTRQSQVQSYIQSALGMNTNRIGARKCSVRLLEGAEARAFLNNTHIQGAPQSIKAAFGLFAGDLLVGVASFGVHHRGLSQIVLNRFACLPEWTVSGGLSKITKTASDYFKTDLITWADMSLSAGNGYEKAGWVLEEELSPDYFYTDFENVFSKQSRRKSAVNTPEGLTEHEHALLDGVFRIYDCGKNRYLFKYKPETLINSNI
jgi:hypothetical protein